MCGGMDTAIRGARIIGRVSDLRAAGSAVLSSMATGSEGWFSATVAVWPLYRLPVGVCPAVGGSYHAGSVAS